MELQIKNGNEMAAQTLSVSDKVFGQVFNESLVHQVVVAYLAGGRAGTRGQKNRAAVRGGGAKPWRQKGTGRARAGTIRSPLWRGGGITFAAAPRDYNQKVNKKMYRAAMRSIFSELVRQDRLIVIDGDSLSITEPKTKLMLAQLAKLGIEPKALLLLTETSNHDLELSIRNLTGVETCPVNAVDPVSLVGFDKVIITAGAAERVGEWLA